MSNDVFAAGAAVLFSVCLAAGSASSPAIAQTSTAPLIEGPRRACSGAKAIDRPASDASNGAHGNRISREFEISRNDGFAEQILGWEYETYGGKGYFQFVHAFSVSAGVVRISPGRGPIVSFRGNVFAAIQGLAKGLGIAQSKLPAPFIQISAKTNLAKGPC